MTFEKTLEKRVRRRITGRSHEFFVVTAPGFENLCYQEILGLQLPENDIFVSKGGVSFLGKVHDCYKANLHLRTAGRILMRVKGFKATNFRQLKRKLAEVEWELYMHPQHYPEISVSARHSRLFHTDAVSSEFEESIRERFKSIHVTTQECLENRVHQKIFVRISDDVFTVSIDSSGELLYKRGMKIHSAKAPVRETIAAAVLNLARYNGTEPLVDPMCGSGTFSLEAAMMSNKIPPGWFRRFAFEEWPCFRPGRWKHIKREVEKKITHSDQVLVFSSDKDAEACRLLDRTVKKLGLSDTVLVSHRSYFDISASDFSSIVDCRGKGLVVVNPPYGIRIGSQEESETLFVDICKKLWVDFQGWRFALVVPQKKFIKKMPFKVKTYPIVHGGLNLTIAVGRVKDSVEKLPDC